MGIYRILVMCICLFATTSMASGSKSSEFITKPQWEKLSKKYNYIENIKKLEVKPNKPISPPRFSLGAAWLKYVLWGFVILVLVAVLVWLLASVFKNTAEKVESNTSFKSLSIENIEEANLEGFLDQALAEGSFKEAIRIRYLMVIRTLSGLHLVNWKKDKTNGAYVSEMYGKAGFDLFRQVTISFERAWYGDKHVGETEYLLIIPVFEQLNQIVISNE